MAGSETPLAILPAGTANLLATNLGIPQDIEQAVAIGLRGERRKLDVGRFNGERFAVMAGAGFDAAMIEQADGTLKDRLGRVAYVWTGSQNLRAKPFKAKIEVDGAPWYAGAASCILVGNVGRLFGGVEVFEDARPDDGRLELGVVNADGVTDWMRTLARTAVGHAERSPLVQATTAKKIKVKLNRKVLYEVDGGDREKVRSFTVKVQPAAITICLPREEWRQWQRFNLIPLRRCAARARAGEGFVQHARLRDPLARRVRRAGARLRDHRPARLRPRGRARRQDHEPAGRAANGRAAVLRSRPARAARDRPRRLRALAAVPRRPRPRPRGRRHAGSSGSARSAAGSSTRLMCAIAVQILTGPGTSGGSAKKTTSDVFGWPAGRWLVGARRARAGRRRRSTSSSAACGRSSSTTRRPSRCRAAIKTWFTASGRSATWRARSSSGSSASSSSRPRTTTRRTRRSASTARSRKLYNGAYGSWLLGAVALGLIAFSCFSLVEARYRRI